MQECNIMYWASIIEYGTWVCLMRREGGQSKVTKPNPKLIACSSQVTEHFAKFHFSWFTSCGLPMVYYASRREAPSKENLCSTRIFRKRVCVFHILLTHVLVLNVWWWLVAVLGLRLPSFALIRVRGYQPPALAIADWMSPPQIQI